MEETLKLIEETEKEITNDTQNVFSFAAKMLILMRLGQIKDSILDELKEK